MEHGDYGNTRGSTKNYAVETTAVLTDMEQVQKLYPCLVIPRRMLAEMKKFFEFRKVKEHLQTAVLDYTSNELQSQDGETVNYKPVPSKVLANKVKMAVLLGDPTSIRHIF